MDCEVLICPGTSTRGRKILGAMVSSARTAGVKVKVTTKWEGAAPVLMSYGVGHPVRSAWTREHVARGGRLLGWDLGYWDREKPDFKMRLTLDDDHPQRWIQPEAPERFDRSGIQLREDADPKGHIVLSGIGRKQREHKGLSFQEWELGTLKDLRSRFPGREIVFKPKRLEQTLPGCRLLDGTIEEALKGASLLVCHHSNVAVDACIAGVPVECEDGAARALYQHGSTPSPEQRLEFLRSLAWWQYSTSEAALAWKFIKRQIG